MNEWIPLIAPILQVVVMASTVMAVFYGMRGEVRILRHDVSHIEKQLANLSEAFSQIGTVLTQVAVQDTRLTLIEKSVDNLRHGLGYIQERKSKHA